MKIDRRFLTRIGALVLVLLLALSFTATLAESFTKSDAGITTKSIKLGTKKDWKTKLTDGGFKYKKGPACVGASYSNIYTKSGIKVVTKPSGKKEEVITIEVTSSKYKTLAGLKVGSSIEDMEELYGTKYYKDGTTYIYTSGSYQLTVRTKSGKVKNFSFTK